MNNSALSDKTIADMMGWMKVMDPNTVPYPIAGQEEEEHMGTPLPYVGQIVHYLSRGSADGVFPKLHRAAIITAVDDGYQVSLFVMNPDGCYFDHGVWLDSNSEIGGTWHYIEEEK